MYRKVKFGAAGGGITGAIAAVFFAVFHKHIPPEYLAAIPAVVAWASQWFTSYMTRETKHE